MEKRTDADADADAEAKNVKTTKITRNTRKVCGNAEENTEN